MREFLELNLAPALISALIAIFIFFASQWFLSRRNSVELKTKKLEELYLSVNELSRMHAIRFDKIKAISAGDRSSLKDPALMSDLYLLDINKKIVMYIRLYFPRLSNVHQNLFKENHLVSVEIYKIIEGKNVDYEKFIEIFTGFGTHISNIEQEIIDNRNILVGENLLPGKYKSSA